jgi:hypothetical protein
MCAGEVRLAGPKVLAMPVRRSFAVRTRKCRDLFRALAEYRKQDKTLT